MLNKIILAVIKRQNISKPDAMQSDTFENPATYIGWIYPIRYLLALRYLKVKQKTLADFRYKRIYPIPAIDFYDALSQRLSNKKNTINDTADNSTKTAESNKYKSPILASIFKAKFIYPVLLVALGAVLYSTSQWKQQKKAENVLANYLPYYSDLLHRKLLLKHNDANKDQIKAIDISINKAEIKILSELPEENGVKDIIQQQLTKLKDPSTDSEEIMLGFKDVNTLFDKEQQPYYLSPKSFTMPCSSLIDAPVEQMMMLKELESLMSNNNPELCRTTMMTTYKVDERTQLFYKDKHQSISPEEVELPLFHVRRIDKVPAVDGALGLTFKERGIGSIILVDRIKNFARESILPALTFQGRSYIIPYWMQGYYEIEEAVTKGYKKDINQIYPDKKEQRKVKTLVKQLIKDKTRMQNAKMEQTMQRTNSNNDNNIFGNGFDAISVLLGKSQKDKNQSKEFTKTAYSKKDSETLKRLDEALYPSIEYHEAYHQINKKEWLPPNWLEPVFKGKLSDNAIEHTLEELGAYLSQLANTKQGQNIWLSKLLIFSLNPMTKGQAEYYASSIIFNAMDALHFEEAIQANYIATVDDKTRIFKVLLNKNSDEISSMARQAYQILFQRDVPNLVNDSLN
ncbi:MAG: hypothetical protein ACI88H_001693 [Cocleimonas sp.]|jgi:hypothetical protein